MTDISEIVKELREMLAWRSPAGNWHSTIVLERKRVEEIAESLHISSERTRDAEAKLAALSLCEPNFLDRKLRELDEAKAVVHEFYLWCSDLNDFRKDSRLARRARDVVNGAVSSATEGGK